MPSLDDIGVLTVPESVVQGVAVKPAQAALVTGDVITSSARTRQGPEAIAGHRGNSTSAHFTGGLDGDDVLRNVKADTICGPSSNLTDADG